MKKTLLIISLLFGAATSSQAFELSKASTPSIGKSIETLSFSSCESSCYSDSDYNICLASGFTGLCTIIYNNCVANCNAGNPGSGGNPDPSPPRYWCNGVSVPSPFHCDEY